MASLIFEGFKTGNQKDETEVSFRILLFRGYLSIIRGWTKNWPFSPFSKSKFGNIESKLTLSSFDSKLGCSVKFTKFVMTVPNSDKKKKQGNFGPIFCFIFTFGQQITVLILATYIKSRSKTTWTKMTYCCFYQFFYW